MRFLLFAILLSPWLISPLTAYPQKPSNPVSDPRSLHREVPVDPYLPNEFRNLKTTPGRYSAGAGTFTSQVNVDNLGNNIVGDAANEPSIAVNPADPSQIVIGWRQFENVNSNFRQAGMGYSVDAGKSWINPGPIEPAVFRSDPVLDADSAGTIFYNSLTTDGGGSFSCQVFRSTTGGATWGNGVDAHGGDKQWMTIDRSGGVGAGNIYSFWTSSYSSCNPGFFTRSTNGGNSYEPCTFVSGNPYWGTLAVGTLGELYTAGAGSGDGIQVARSSNAKIPGAAVSWDFTSQANMDGYISASPEVNPVGLLGQAYIDIDRSDGPGRNNIYLVASVVRLSNGDPGDVMFVRSDDGGYSWSNPLRINNDATPFHYQWFGTMSVAPNGRIDVAWLDTRNDPNSNILSALYYSYSEDQGVTWSVNNKLSDVFDPRVGWPQQSKLGDYFDMESDNTGAHLAWSSTLNGEQDVYYTRIIPTIVSLPENNLSTEPLVMECMPNPFRESATLKYTVPAAGKVNLSLFNIYGQKVCTLVDEVKNPGMYTLSLSGENLPGGVLIARLSAGSRTCTQRLISL